jgi:pentatricopeptide repeat protein
MAQNLVFTNVKRSCLSSKRGCQRIVQCQARYSSNWFRRFISPSEEKALYLGITSSFREKLVEQSHKSAKLYGNIIENAITSADNAKSSSATTTATTKIGQLSVARINELKAELDAAGKNKHVEKLQELQAEMDSNQLKVVTMYNRLIRAYLTSNEVDLAHGVLLKLEARGLLPTTRTYTYMIQANVKCGNLEAARQLIQQMQDLSLMKLRTGFDCNVIMEFYEACGDHHAIEFLWRDIMQHVDAIKPGLTLYTHYLKCLLHSKTNMPQQVQDEKEGLVQLAKDMMQRGHAFQFNTSQYTHWIHAVPLLTQENTLTAENLLLYLLPKLPLQPNNSGDTTTHHHSWIAEKGIIHHIIDAYIKQDQELKALAFYYRLRTMGVPNKAFDPHVLESIKGVLSRVEQRQGDEENKAITAEFGLLRPSVE